MRTIDAALLLLLSPGRVRCLTTHALPRRLPCEWTTDGRSRVFDPVEVRLWDLERKEWWLYDGDAQRALRRAKLEKKYGCRLGVTPDVLDRWAERGWK